MITRIFNAFFMLIVLASCAHQGMKYTNPFKDPLIPIDQDKYPQKQLVMYRLENVMDKNLSANKKQAAMNNSQTERYQRIDFLLFDFHEK